MAKLYFVISMINQNDKISRSNQIFPIFSGLSSDLLFWVAISTLFLTEVKGYNAAQISLLTSISTLVSLMLYPLAIKLIKRIGDINSVRLGTVLFLCSALLLTFGNMYILVLLGYVLYDMAYTLKGMDVVLLRKNLKCTGHIEDHVKILGKASLIYSLVTMVISFVAGYLFNINRYLPMICCIGFSIVNILLSGFLYEQKKIASENNLKKTPLRLSGTVFFILLLFAVFNSVVDLGQSNGQLLIQYKLEDFLEINKVAIYLSIIVAVSRIARVLFNLVFIRLCSRNTKTVVYEMNGCLIASFVLVIIGNMIGNVPGIILMSIGFFCFLGVRDPFSNYMKTLLLNNCNEEYHEQMISYLTMSKTGVKFFISTAITLLLLKVSMIYIILLLLLISVANTFIVRKIYKLSAL